MHTSVRSELCKLTLLKLWLYFLTPRFIFEHFSSDAATMRGNACRKKTFRNANRSFKPLSEKFIFQRAHFLLN